MLSKDGTVFKSLLILLFLSIGSAAASGWYQVYEDASQSNIKDAVFGSNGIDGLYAVGDAGMYYQLQHFGNEWSWDTLTISNDNLGSIATTRDWGNNGIQIHVAAGQNGAVLNFDGGLNQWFTHDSLGKETYNKVYFDENTSRFWVGGDKGQLYYSQDYGRHWDNKAFDPTLNIMGFSSDYNWLFIFAEKNDTTFVLRESMNSGTFYSVPGDTLPDIMNSPFTRRIRRPMNCIVVIWESLPELAPGVRAKAPLSLKELGLAVQFFGFLCRVAEFGNPQILAPVGR